MSGSSPFRELTRNQMTMAALRNERQTRERVTVLERDFLGLARAMEARVSELERQVMSLSGMNQKSAVGVKGE